MKPSAILALLMCTALTADADTLTPYTPRWLQAKIAKYEKLPAFSPPRSIQRTLHQGKTVYYISPACCDIPSELYDEAGTLVCYPDGGFAGGDGRCPGFNMYGSVTVPIWRDGRQGTSGKPQVK